MELDRFDDVYLTERLLAGDGSPRGDAALRSRLLGMTQAKIQRRRTARRGMWAAGMALAYLAGLATQRMWHAPAATVARHDVAVQHDIWPQPAPADEMTAAMGELIDVAELAARPRKSSAAVSDYQRLRRAGDNRLLAQGDVAGALKFYRRALNAATTDELQAGDATDTWLMTALKSDRHQQLDEEPSHADDQL